MDEYQISVARDGKFLFRTDWMRFEYYEMCVLSIVEGFTKDNGYIVTMGKRSASIWTKEITQ